MMQGWKPQGEFAKKYWNDGLEKGLERGLEQGLERGRMAERAHSLEVILEARGFALTEAQRVRIAEASLDTLERWLVAAITAPTVDDALV